MKKRPIAVLFFRLIPKAFLSRIFGRIARSGLSRFYINRYIRNFAVNTEEIDFPEGGFTSLEHFFTRKLKKGSRKIDKGSDSLVSPVDARVDQLGDITGTRIIQAKGMDYLLADLIPTDVHHLFIDGKFVTLYLSPSDYHRIHSPIDGRISESLYVPGKLFSVQDFMVNGIKRLFTKNERVATMIDTEFGKCVVVKVGAMNVGRISLSYDNLITNAKLFRKKRELHFSPEMQPHTHRGDELGQFHLGSTVVMLFQKDMVDFESIKLGSRVQVGQRIGSLNKKP